MNSEPSVPKCPQCGVAIPADAPQGLCPRCVLLGAATPTDAGKPIPRTEPPSPEALRVAFPHLEIVELIGRGGMGFVYKARQAKLDRLVALKLLPLELGADPHFAERFHREARALARLNHPGIVAVYDFGVSAGFGYLLMEFVDGVNLRQAMQAGRFTQREALALVPKICEAIQFAHEQGVLHRDIKPENILLDTQGRVKIADFGIAKLVGEDAPDLTLTLSGARLGTPTYMAPEQVEHPGTVDHRADIYSLGVVFYELLTGELPLGRFAPPSAKADLDARVDDIVMRALAKERELRQQSAGEVKTEVETVAASPRNAVAAAAPAAGPAPRSWSVKSWIGSWLLVFAGVVGALLVFVAGRTVHDLGMGRSRTQPVELVVFLVVSGAALLCWRLGRRLHGQSEPAVPAEPIVPRPFLFADVAAGWKPWLLLGLGLGGVLLSVQAVILLLPMVGAIAGLMRSGPLPFLLVLLAGCALVAGAWQCGLRRRELLHSLSLHVPETGLALDRWLSRAVVLLLAGLGGGMLIGFGSLFMVVAAQLNGNPGSNGLLLAAVVVIIGLVASWHRRDANPPTPTPAPAWMRRVAWWFFAAGAVALLPTLVSWNSASSVWHTASLLLFTGLALLSTHRGLRRLALVVNWFEVFSGLGGCLALLWFGRYSFPGGITIGVPGITYRPGIGLLFGLLQTGAFAAGLIALHRADARAAFGVTRPAGARRVWGIVTLAGVGFALVLFSIIQWKAQRVTFTDWTASPMMMAGARERTGATLHFTEASTAGSVLLLNIYSEPGFQPHAVTPQFAGAAAMVSQAMVPDGLSTDCLLEPRRGDNGVGDEGGRLLAGSRELAGPGTLRIGFVFPSVELAGLARDQVQKDWVGRTRILERPEVLVLFQLQRSKLVDPTTGQPMEEGFLGSLAFNHANPANANPLPAPVPSADVELAAQRIALAQEQLATARRRAEVGLATSLEMAKAERDLAVLMAGTNAVEAARAKLKYATQAAEEARAQHAVGSLGSLELHQVVQAQRAAEIELASAEDAETKAAQGWALYAQLAPIRLNLARRQLTELRSRAALGLLAQEGPEIVDAELEVAVAEAEVKGDPRAAAQARMEHAGKILKLTEVMASVGKATAAELNAAKLALAEAEEALRHVAVPSPKP
jgi:tRNA A-37 threonylcarbamoyl transferase component Bud32